MNSHNTNPPFLPPELERTIFELSAHLHPGSAPKLLLVAHRVLTWIEPLIYRVISIERNSDPILRTLHLKPTQFFDDNVQHLFVDFDDDTNDELEEILSVCTGIRSLVVLGTSASALSSVLRLRPSKLAIALDTLFGRTHLVDFSHPLSTTVTHLDLFDSDFAAPLQNFALLPALTHLALLGHMSLDVEIQVLRNCPHVEVLVSMHTRPESFERFPVADDVRFVSMSLSNLQYKLDWKSGANGGMDFWARADKFVAMKRRGEIKPRLFPSYPFFCSSEPWTLDSRHWIVSEDGI
ncbi:hypothetical protein B0H11DRAFT_1747186 [Mycena galericulata]|nr:hypothetical protein B0H11DRAFT_1747186 [Mycena galericulata]